MKANEFRVTNFVNYNGEMFPIIFIGLDFVVLIRKDQSFTVKLDRIKPIQVTEDILKYFGAKYKNEYWFEFHTYGIIKHTTFIEFYSSVEGDFICNSVKYLHELQNLYFALTGSELVFSTER